MVLMMPWIIRGRTAISQVLKPEEDRCQRSATVSDTPEAKLAVMRPCITQVRTMSVVLSPRSSTTTKNSMFLSVFSHMPRS